MTSRSERVCLRGCVSRGVHLETCEDRDKTVASSTCRGCAPRPARSGALVCDGCFGRMRRLLSDAPDLLGRVRSLSCQGKAQVYRPVKVSVAPSTAPDQVSSDELDALIEISANLADWAVALEPASWRPRLRASWSAVRVSAVIAGDVAVILRGLDAIANDHAGVLRLAEAVLVAHTPDADGSQVWSLADAMNRWGVVRCDRVVAAYADDDDEGDVLERMPVTEWDDPLLTLHEAWKLAGSERKLQRWLKRGDIAPAGEIWIAGKKTRMFRRSDVLRVAEAMRARSGGRPSSGTTS